MITDRILLTTPCYPYPSLPANDSFTDATGQRFTHGDDIFSIVSHTHCYANHILAQNINIPTTLLEYPRWNNFIEEVDKEYAIIGISAFPVHLDMVMKMCKYIRDKSPKTKLLGNQLNTLPSSLDSLISLEKLNLGLNDLKNIPNWIRNLRSLKKLGLGGNKGLSRFEEWIYLLPQIIELNLYDNDIKELPESIGLLNSLEVLIMPNNNLTILPESFKKLSSLKKLDLSWNDITILPEWINSLSSLEELNLRGNKLLKLPHSMSSIQSLRSLNVSLNKDIIQIPEDLKNKGLHIIK